MRKNIGNLLLALTLGFQVSCLSQACWAAGPEAAIPIVEPLRTVSDSEVRSAFSGAKYKKQLRNLKWTPAVGWNGLVVGKSTLSDAEKKFGAAKKDEEGPGETQYVLKAPVRLWIADGSHVIEAIEVYVGTEFVEQTPLTVQDARTMYGPLKQVNELQGCTIERWLQRPGLRVNAESMDKNARVYTLFFMKK